MSRIPSFTPTSPLLPGATLIEASAGTGKTYQITNLVLRLVAEQELALDEILVVTFTKAATADLRGRIRERLSQAVRLLESCRASGEPPADEVLALLAGATPDSPQVSAALVERRLGRLRAALQGFDAAAIFTIHGFCQRMLQLFAFESEAPFGAELIDDLQPLQDELVDDFLSRTLWDQPDDVCALLLDEGRLNRGTLQKLATLRLQSLDARLLPDPPAVSPGEALGDWQQEVARFAQRWQEGGRDEVVALLDAETTKPKTSKKGEPPKRVNGNRYQTQRTHQNAEALDAWLAGSRVPTKELVENWGKYFMASRIAEGQADPLTHPLFAAWEELHARAPAVLAALVGPRLTFARELDARLQEALARQNGLAFHDLLHRLRDRLVDPVAGPALAQGIRGRFRAALIDEFQDTDGVQWTIFSRIFLAQPPAPLFLIGDPKQAIYGFRGADVHVYQQATQVTPADQRSTLETNHRADDSLVTGMNCLFGGRTRLFDLDFIDYVPVRAKHPERLRVAGGSAVPIRLGWFDEGLFPDEDKRFLSKDDAWELLPRLVADEIVRLLEAKAELVGADGAWRPLTPGDCAVLVRKNKQAKQLARALRARGIASVRAGADSVFASPEALSLQRWLTAILQPGKDRPVRAFAVDPLCGWDAQSLLRADPAAAARYGRFVDRLARQGRLLLEGGFQRAFSHLLELPVPGPGGLDQPLLTRLFSWPDGERRVTDLRHLQELLHEAETVKRLRGAGLLRWLAEQRAADTTRPGDAVALRLESDAEAVQLVTLHASKGLQYPVVFLPYLWDGIQGAPAKPAAVRFHDPPPERGLCLDLALDEENVARAAREEQQENLRLLYVGVTRARHQVVIFAGYPGSRPPGYETSPLAALLHGGQPGEEVPDRLARAQERVLAFGQNRSGLFADLQAIAASSVVDGRPTIAAFTCPLPGDRLYEPPVTAAEAALTVRRFRTEPLETGWRRLSYTALTRGKELHGEAPEDPSPLGAQPDDHGRDRDDEEPGAVGSGAATPETPAPDERELDGDEVPLARVPSGKDFGTFVHAIFEHLDFVTGCAKDDPSCTLAALIAERGRRAGFTDPALLDGLAQAIPRILATPLGGPLGPRALREIPLADRLDELHFDLPLAGGNAWRYPAPLVSGREFIARMVRRGPGEAVRAEYLAALTQMAEAGRFGGLCGYLEGSLDLVFRAPDPATGHPRWFVADYKTNLIRSPRRPGTLLGRPARRPSTPAHYRHPWLCWAMEQHNYYLQYHLYLVALHRFLRRRLPEYDYDRDVGGAYYLFVRGMGGEAATIADAGRADGVFFDRPPASVIEELSELFAKPSGGEV